MLRAEIEAKLREDLAIARLRSGADPDSVERQSELEVAVRRYTGFLVDLERTRGAQELKVMAQAG